MALTLEEFVRRWKLNVLSERSGSQSHFIDLCEVLGQPHPAAADGDARVQAIAEAARELVRLRDAWLNPPGATEDELKQRTLTKLYNARPEWLANAHRTLDEAVFAAYGWPSDLIEQGILARLLKLNHERAAAQG